MEPRICARAPALKSATVIEVCAGMIECVVIGEDSAVGYVRVVVENDAVAMPIVSPVMPSPAKTAKEADSKAEAKRKSRSGQVQPWIPIPTGPNTDGLSVREPRIILRHVNDLGVGRFDRNGLSLLRHGFLRRAFQIPSLLRAIAHHLNSIHHVLLLVDVS